MNFRCLSFVAGLTALVSLAQGQVAPHSALANTKAVKQTWIPPRTADGHPDLTGIWVAGGGGPLPGAGKPKNGATR